MCPTCRALRENVNRPNVKDPVCGITNHRTAVQIAYLHLHPSIRFAHVGRGALFQRPQLGSVLSILLGCQAIKSVAFIQTVAIYFPLCQTKQRM